MKRPDMGLTVERTESREGTRIILEGVVDEFADLQFFAHLSGRVDVDLRGVRRINSFGVRTWVDAVRTIPDAADVRFVALSPALVEQTNMVRGFLGRGTIVSVMVPMICETCDAQALFEAQVADLHEHSGAPGAQPCPECGSAMVLDDLPDQYFAFLDE